MKLKVIFDPRFRAVLLSIFSGSIIIIGSLYAAGPLGIPNGASRFMDISILGGLGLITTGILLALYYSVVDKKFRQGLSEYLLWGAKYIPEDEREEQIKKEAGLKTLYEIVILLIVLRFASIFFDLIFPGKEFEILKFGIGTIAAWGFWGYYRRLRKKGIEFDSIFSKKKKK